MRALARYGPGVLVACLLALYAHRAAAAPGDEGAARPLLLAEVEASIERHFPLIAAAQKDEQAAEAELLAARGAFDPLLRGRAEGTALGYYRSGRADLLIDVPTPLWGASFFSGWRLGAGSFADYDGKLATNAYGELRAGVAVPLWRNGPIDRRRAAVRRAELGRPLAALGVVQQRLESVRLGSQRYWEWVAAGQRLRIANELLQLAVTRDGALVERVRRGDLPALERTDNQRALVQRQALVVAAERALQQAQIELSLYLRDERGEPVLAPLSRLPRELPLPRRELPTPEQLERLVQAALGQRPEGERLRLQREQLAVERDLARNQRAPSLDVAAAVSQDLGPGAASRSPTQLDLSLSIELSPLNRAARGRQAVAEAAMARLAVQERLLRDRIRAEVQDVLSVLQASQRRAELAAEERLLALQVETGERTRYELGDSTLLFINLREQATAEAALRELDALLDCQRALAAYRAILAAPRGEAGAPP
ncbi:MAG: TolC family protein [Polyangia bacterium]